MAEKGDDSRSSLSPDGVILGSGGESVYSSNDKSTNMNDFTTASSSEDLGTQNNVAVSHSANAPKISFPFLKLPPELRMRVYYQVFHLKRGLYFDGYCALQEVDLSLLITCRQIYEEARYEIFKCNTFHFDDFMNREIFVRHLLPDQESAIRSISVMFESGPGIFDTTFSMDFPDICEDLRQFLSGFKRLRNVEISVCGIVDSLSVNDRFQNGLDDWEEGITSLQTLGSLHWEGDMTEHGLEEDRFEIQGLLRLRIGHGEGILGDPEFGGVSGNELRLLFRNRRVSWQELMKETTTDQVELNL